jgi:hypothetical protein
MDIVAAVRVSRIVLLVVALLAMGTAVAVAAPVQFFIDSEPVGLGRDVVVDFNPSTLTSEAETPDSLAFLLPATWRFDHRAVARECTPAQAAAVRCPYAAQVGYGHVVLQAQGYLFPGGQTQVVAYITPYVGEPRQAGDPASLVLEVQMLGIEPLIDAANQYLRTKIKPTYSITGRVIPLHSGAYGLEASFDGFPGGLTLPPQLTASGVSVTVTRFKLQIGAVRRVKKPKIDKFSAPTLSGGTQTIDVRDHVLIGYHLLSRGRFCPSSDQWPWELQVGFPAGVQDVKGSVTCGR